MSGGLTTLLIYMGLVLNVTYRVIAEELLTFWLPVFGDLSIQNVLQLLSSLNIGWFPKMTEVSGSQQWLLVKTTSEVFIRACRLHPYKHPASVVFQWA
jgi:hypothetical protein